MYSRAVSCALLVLLAAFPSLFAGGDNAAKWEIAGFLVNVQPVGPPDLQHLTPGGVLIIRGLPVVGEVTGDLVGTWVLDQNSNWNAKGNGGTFGPIFMDVSWDGMSGTFQGESGANVKNFFVTNLMVLHGAGDFEGYKLQIKFEGFLGADFTYAGFLIDPNPQN